MVWFLCLCDIAMKIKTNKNDFSTRNECGSTHIAIMFMIWKNWYWIDIHIVILTAFEIIMLLFMLSINKKEKNNYIIFFVPIKIKHRVFFYSNSSISWLKANQAYYHQVYYTKQQKKLLQFYNNKKTSYDFSVWWVNSISTATEWERKNHIQQKPILKNLYFLSLILQLDGVYRMEYRRIYALIRQIFQAPYFSDESCIGIESHFDKVTNTYPSPI